MYHIDQIKFIETGPYQYQIAFLYNTHALQTDNLPKSSTVGAIVPILQQLCANDDVQSATANYTSLKNAFDGKSADI